MGTAICRRVRSSPLKIRSEGFAVAANISRRSGGALKPKIPVTPSGIACATVHNASTNCATVEKYYNYEKTVPFGDMLLETRHDLVKANKNRQNKLLRLPSAVGT